MAGAFGMETCAQDPAPADTVFFLAHKKGLLGRIGKSLSVNNPDLPVQDSAKKNEDAFAPFRGKRIRYIFIQKIGFEKNVNDTVKVVRNIFSRIGDALHTSTRQKIVRNNLFMTEGDTLYPALVADNERYLRQLSYIQDARILVKEIASDSAAVDLIVVCKDVFPVGGSMQSATGNSVSFEANDDNLVGTGNRLQLEQLVDGDRAPHYGFGVEFLKRNINGSFINLSVGYQNQAATYNSGRREEKALYLRGELPLVSPYHSWTGAFELARHTTFNGYREDSLYNAAFKYNYRLFDGWIGHNIGARRNLKDNLRSRYRKLVAVRAIHRVFDDLPDAYKGTYNIGYSNLSSLLASFNIFEQDFYHTNFLYGFGRNEDLPEGFNISVTGGWSKRDNISRAYGGFEYRRSYFSRRQDYINYRLSLGGYFNGDRFEDLSFLTGLDFITKLRKLGSGHWYMRHFLSGSITQLANTMQNEVLRIASDFGIPRLNDPNLRASTRITLNGESVFYNTWKLLGFSFAPFGFANVTYLKSIGRYFTTGDIYTAIGGGVRTRNENLVFGTMEMKLYYYPRTTGGISPWNITFNSELRYRYETQLIRRPDFPVLN
ncbi:BamA/TamA family outer membrane protein [Sediminibacterium soli]|uniref:hypothetical protein n=1 Tax=Sediminibacterium soli TaxID=2698829 RepID=UPI00137B8720|nr:hypothetical protein [Sediminibacterium soli]NCI46635.1 hypothetical protein [Sediminibacterium soli]